MAVNIAKAQSMSGEAEGDGYNSFNLSGPDRDILLWHFNAVTPENMMKPDAMQSVEGDFTFNDADAMIGFCRDNGIAAVGHTLAWHSQTPDYTLLGRGK